MKIIFGGKRKRERDLVWICQLVDFNDESHLNGDNGYARAYQLIQLAVCN